MKPAGDLRPPGVYPARDDAPTEALTAASTRVAGFVGLAQKGPLDVPTRIRSWGEFVDRYGQTHDGYLSRSVEAYFLNGGDVCYITRVAHRAKDDEKPGVEHASCAERVYLDGWDKPTLRVRAQTEGRWGNNIWSQFLATAGARTLLTLDLEVGAGVAQVPSTRGFERGALVKIFDREAADYVVLTEVSERTIKWSTETPVRRRYRAAGPTYLEVYEFELHVALRDLREVFKGLQLSPMSRRYVGRVVSQESLLVTVDDLKTKSPPPHFLPTDQPAAKLTNGRDGHDSVTPEDIIGYDHGPGDRRGIMTFVGVPEVAMLVCPDAMLPVQRQPGPQGEMGAQRIQDAMINLCENEKDRFALIDAPDSHDIEVIKRWRRRLDSSYVAMYYPWLTIENAQGVEESMPSSGFVAGITSRCEAEIGVHKAPANEIIKGAEDVTIKLTEDHLGMLNNEGVNCIRVAMGRGIRVWGARTCSSDPDWRYVNVRRLFIMMRRSLAEGTRWAAFEPNHPTTWNALRAAVSEFLGGLWNRGMFASGRPEDSFYVQCDAETNPPEVRDAGQLIMNIGVAPALPAEFILLKVVQKTGQGVGNENLVE